MTFYFDSSVLLKRYIAEKGSERVDALFLEADAIAVSALGLPEIISTLCRLHREKKLSSAQYNQCKQAVIDDFAAFDVYPLSPEITKATMDILERSDLRAADAIHVACAMEAKAIRFISSDVRQIKAAKDLHLKVESV